MSAVQNVDEALLRAWRPPPLDKDGDKEARGRVLVMSGGPEVGGAVLLTAEAALRAGAGKLQIGAPRSLAASLALAMPEARVIGAAETASGELAPQAADDLQKLLARSAAGVIGPGMLDEVVAGELARRLLASGSAPMVVDAAAMTGLSQDPDAARGRGGELVLTPHAGEMAALAGVERAAVLADPLGTARGLAARLQAVVALKGSATLIVSPDGKAWRHEGHAPGLATSGSGDVLAGIVGGLLARGCPPAQAAVWGVYTHAEAGRRLARRLGRIGFLARELLAEIPAVLDGLENA